MHGHELDGRTRKGHNSVCRSRMEAALSTTPEGRERIDMGYGRVATAALRVQERDDRAQNPARQKPVETRTSAANPPRAMPTRSQASSSTTPMIVIEQDSSMQPAEDTVLESPSKRKRNVDPADFSESGMG